MVCNPFWVVEGRFAGCSGGVGSLSTMAIGSGEGGASISPDNRSGIQNAYLISISWHFDPKLAEVHSPVPSFCSQAKIKLTSSRADASHACL